MANKPTYEQLEQRLKELEKTHNELELRVEGRTAELLAANEQLGNEVEEQRRVETALRESEEKYRSLVERANDGIGIVQDGMMKYANPRLAAIGDYAVAEVIGAPFTDFIHPDELKNVAAHYRKRMEGGQVPQDYETRLLHKEAVRYMVKSAVVSSTMKADQATSSSYGTSLSENRPWRHWRHQRKNIGTSWKTLTTSSTPPTSRES